MIDAPQCEIARLEIQNQSTMVVAYRKVRTIAPKLAVMIAVQSLKQSGAASLRPCWRSNCR